MKVVVLRNLRSAVTFGLILWCAGAGCMIVSVAHGAAMSEARAARVSSSGAGWGRASGSMGTHDCCKARHAAERSGALSITNHASSAGSSAGFEEISESPNSSDAMSCCPLTSGTFVTSGRQSISPDEAPVPRGVDAISVVTSVAVKPLFISLRLPNQDQTYLRDCVFLI